MTAAMAPPARPPITAAPTTTITMMSARLAATSSLRTVTSSPATAIGANPAIASATGLVGSGGRPWMTLCGARPDCNDGVPHVQPEPRILTEP